jgi:hypothetical protein
LQFGASVADLPTDLEKLTREQLLQARDVAAAQLFPRGGWDRSAALATFLSDLCDIYKEVRGEWPKIGRTMSANNPEKSGIPSSPAIRFLLAAGAVASLTPEQAVEAIRAHRKAKALRVAI